MALVIYLFIQFGLIHSVNVYWARMCQAWGPCCEQAEEFTFGVPRWDRGMLHKY